MVAEFRGPSPHDLGTAELATVQVLEKNIEVMLHLLDDWHRPMGPVVRVQISALDFRCAREHFAQAVAELVLFLDAEVEDGEVEVQIHGVPDRRHVAGAVPGRAHSEHLAGGGDLARLA